jgi:hypothetical protein
MTRSRSPRLPDAAQALSRNLHWFALAGGVTVTVLCAGFLLNAPLGVSLALPPAAKDVFTSELGDKDGRAEVLAGISGETFAPGVKMTASEDIVISNDEHELAKVMLEDGADRRCLTVTAASGQTLSFRIVGARPLPVEEKPNAGKVELAVAACARNGQNVVKAVIEPEAGQQPKPAESGHSL